MTETGIANLVLSHLGAAPVTSINDATPEAEAIRDAWNAVRDALIRAHRWNFAKARAYLTPVVLGESFALPTDCLRVTRVNGVEQSGTLGEGAEIEGRTLRLPAAVCEIVYLRSIPNPDDWDSLFTLVFAYELAAASGARIAGGSQSLSEGMRANALQQLRVAMAANAIETRPTVVRAIDGSRFYGSVHNISMGTPYVPHTPVPPATPVLVDPVTSLITADDGSLREMTLYPDGRRVFKVVYLDLPTDGATYEESTYPSGEVAYKLVETTSP